MKAHCIVHNDTAYHSEIITCTPTQLASNSRTNHVLISNQR